MSNKRRVASSSLADSFAGFQRDFLEALRIHDTPSLYEWDRLAGEVNERAMNGSLDPEDAKIVVAVASNVQALSADVLQMQRTQQSAVEMIVGKLQNLLGSSEAGCKRFHGETSSMSTPSRSSKRPRAEPFASPSEPATRPSSPYPAPSSEGPQPQTQEPDHTFIRTWFLQNLSKPYPTASQKEYLSKKAGITVKKVDSDLTNFRRRSGWTDLMQKFAGGDRDKMKKMIERVAAGKEEREEVLERVEGIKDYLGKREEERVGDWVREITALSSNIPSLTDLPSDSSDSSSTISKHRSTSSLSSMSTVSNLIRPSQRSSSGSSTFSTTSSVSDASFTMPMPVPSKKRLNPNAEPFTPNKRYIPNGTPMTRDAQQHARWIGAYDPSIWSTNTNIPLLPHMSSTTHNSWTIPSESGFQPDLAWSGRSVSGITAISSAL
ncbi:uncharacterized protein I303_104917 [Kwoniella dejecticola CBS 10117]|uniref:KN homeodomain domain-containing protein n=1 Tax=Kwoniella dejecticola CBS 10117 TaxID=1296121 RepID=A0A1A6A3Z3_9TREE|nr:uncharacterized protein I303_05637 [Kwoniella dejecticola CBS 10117]OBR84778.1 hypothetical protein I303_05637 [Kwoniella dejecticola CBS 10117]